MQICCRHRTHYRIRIYCSIIYPSATPPDLLRNLPFTLTTADCHEIDSWTDVLRTAPDHRYVNKLLIGTPTKIDAIEAEPVCPYCNSPADNEIDEITYFCSERCSASSDASNFQPAFQITTTLRMNFEGARKYLACSNCLSCSGSAGLLEREAKLADGRRLTDQCCECFLRKERKMSNRKQCAVRHQIRSPYACLNYLV
jgi:hypothetical protein